jgi:hypothetical protein
LIISCAPACEWFDDKVVCYFNILGRDRRTKKAVRPAGSGSPMRIAFRKFIADKAASQKWRNRHNP